MACTLLLRFAGPQQSWGMESRFTIRDSGREPSKSGVIGLLCAALGKSREETEDDDAPRLSDLASLRMGVRVDREGTLLRDYQTAGGGSWPGRPKYGVYKASGKGLGTVVSERFYLADADFLVGLEGSLDLLMRLDRALVHPSWQLFLGRKSYVPSLPVRLPDVPPWGPGLRELSLRQALSGYGHRGLQIRRPPDQIRMVLECEFGTASNEVRNDVPLSFKPRKFTARYVQTEWIDNPASEA